MSGLLPALVCFELFEACVLEVQCILLPVQRARSAPFKRQVLEAETLCEAPDPALGDPVAQKTKVGGPDEGPP